MRKANDLLPIRSKTIRVAPTRKTATGHTPVLALYRLLDAFCEGGADAGHRREVRNGRLAHPTDAPESSEQRALLGRSDAIDVVEDAPHRALGTHFLVVSDREPVRLVTDALHEVEPL